MINYFDGVVLASIFLSGFFSYYRGLVKDLMSITKWVVAAIVAKRYYYLFHEYFLPIVWNNTEIANVLSGLVLFMITLISFTILLHILTIPSSSSVFKSIDRSLGLCLV